MSDELRKVIEQALPDDNFLRVRTKPTKDQPSYQHVRDAAYNAVAPLLEAQRTLAEKLLIEAQTHAQEARAQRAIVQECYQIATGATGEPGDWQGAAPVRLLADTLTSVKQMMEEEALYFLRLYNTERKRRKLVEIKLDKAIKAAEHWSVCDYPDSVDFRCDGCNKARAIIYERRRAAKEKADGS